MPVPNAVKKQLEEAEAALQAAEAEGTPIPQVVEDPPPKPEAEQTPAQQESTPSIEGMQTQISALTEQLDKRENDRSAYEGRYAKEREEMQARIEEMEEQNKVLQQQAQQAAAKEAVPKVTLEDVFTEEQRELLGDDYLEAMLRSARTVAQQQQLVIDSKLDAVSSKMQTREQDLYLRTVLSGTGLNERELVRVDNSKEFNNWLETPNGIGGNQTIYDTLEQATSRGDARTTTEVYSAFLKTLNTPSQQESPAVMPQASGQVSSNVDKPTYSMDDVAAMYQKGRINHAQMTEMMNTLDAQMQRKINAEAGR